MNLKVNDRERWIIKLVRLAGKINKGRREHQCISVISVAPYNMSAPEAIDVQLLDLNKAGILLNNRCKSPDGLKAAYEELTELAWKGGLL